MKLTSCMLTENYELGNTACEGCELGLVSVCKEKYPDTEDYGVVSNEPDILTAYTGFFGLPPRFNVAEAWCDSAKGSADVVFPGHLWTRDSAGTLTRETAPEATTIPRMCTA